MKMDPKVLTRDNFAKNCCHSTSEKQHPWFMGLAFYRSVAQRFKQQFNENSKSAAKWEVFPELDHNEIVGWEGRGEQCK